MTLTALLNRSVTLVRRSPSGAVDEFGGDIATETLVETVGELQQQRRDEPGDAGEMSDTRWLLILPAATDIDTGDGVVCDGLIFEVVGAPDPLRNPRKMTASHVEVTLRRVATSDEAGS